MSKLDTKIEVSVGCTNFLVNEVETLRRKNELLLAKTSVMDNFFGLVNRLGDAQRTGYGEDQLWQAKKEIEAATQKADNPPMSGQ